MTGRTNSRMREAEEVLPLLALQTAPKGYVSYTLKTDATNRRQITAKYGSMPTNNSLKHGVPVTPRPSGNQSETESDSDGSCTGASSTTGSLQSILRAPSYRNLKKHVSVEFALDIDSDEDDETKRRLEGSCAARCMPRRLTIDEKAALYQLRPDLELVPTVLLLSELEEIRRRRQRKLMFSILGATLILLMMIVFYYLVSQM